MIFSESIAPDCVIEFSDADLDAASETAPACDCCGRTATVTDGGLPWCVLCLCAAQLEYAPELVAAVLHVVERSAYLVPGVRVSYRRSVDRTFSGVIVADTCGECQTAVHVRPDGGDIHHVPVACLLPAEDAAGKGGAL